MSGNNAIKNFGYILVICISIMFISYGLVHISLGFTGAQAAGKITHIRRQGGERSEPVPNRYTYIISYSFSLPSGKKADGFTYKIGSPAYIKVTDSNTSTFPIRYLEALPQLNAPESETGIKAGNLTLIGTGLLLVKLIKPVRRIHRLKG